MPRIALIFDDGPYPEHAPRLLALFAQEQIHVTFASVAARVNAHANIAKAVLAGGHEIVNHSFDHLHPKEFNDAALEHEIVGAQIAITAATGSAPKWYWPPYLEVDDRVRAAVARAGIAVYAPRHLVVTKDYDRQVGPEEIRRNAVTGIKEGTVIVFHEWREETLDQLPAIIAELRRQGYEFLTFSELAR